MSRATQSIFGLAGVVLPFAGSAAPSGWLLCFGQAVSRTEYAHLFSVVGTTFGAGNGTTTFNLPDLRGRVPGGKDDMGGTAAGRLTTAGSGVNGAAIGATGGTQTHTLTAAQMPVHAHGVTDPTHAHSVYDPGHSHSYRQVTVANGQGSQVGTANNHQDAATGVSATGIGIYAAATGISIQNAGSGAAHNNTQPTIVLNHIIKT